LNLILFRIFFVYLIAAKFLFNKGVAQKDERTSPNYYYWS
jgi:hypothetical protein